MTRRLAIATAFVGALAAGALFSPSASAHRVAWSVSIGAPGVAVAAGAPYYYYRPWRHHYHHYHHAYLYGPRVAYVAPYAVTYAAPAVVVRRPYYYHGRRRVYYRY